LSQVIIHDIKPGIYINFFAASNNCSVIQKHWYITGYKTRILYYFNIF